MRCAWLFLFLGGVLGACSRSEPESSPAPDKSASTHPAFTQAAAFAERLTNIRAAAEKMEASGEKACDDAAIRRALGSEAGRALAAESGYLARYGDPTAAPRYRGGDERWQFLTTPALRAIRGPVELESQTAAIDTAYGIKQLLGEYRYLAVVRATTRRLPKMTGDRFEAGAFSGWIGLFNLQTGALVCQARVDTQSGPDVAAKEGTSPERALWNDFAMRVRRALDDSMGRITRHLRLDLG